MRCVTNPLSLDSTGMDTPAFTHDADSVSCPSCLRPAASWETAERYGIECPHCGHTEAFSQPD